jgi:O-acetyl-ADP-ribose deacetylase (regulator of RNase III)
MVTYVKGDIFKSPAQVLTNTVNCVGAMGKGVALEFKNRYPKMFFDYKDRCDHNNVKPGIPYLWEDERSQILNFPTKRHWREDSQLQDIIDGLKYLAENYQNMSIQSLAMPALGCGNGGLNWTDVKPQIDKYLGSIPDLDVYVYEPQKVSTINLDSEQMDLANQDSVDKTAAKSPEL